MQNITVFSPNLVGTVGCNGVRGNYARIGWDTFTRSADVTASSSRAGFPVESLKNATTYDRWSPSSLPAWAEFDNGSNVDVEYLGIASHTLAGTTVSVQYSHDDIDWDTAIVLQPSKNDALFAWWEPITARYWRILVDGDGTRYVGVVNLGMMLEMIRPITGNHSPAVLSRKTDTIPAKSDSGQFLGRTVIRQGLSTDYDWENLDPQWYRDNFDPFVESAAKFPFFFVANPARWPGECIYAWTSKDVKPRYQGDRDWMRVTIIVEAIG